MKNKPEPKWNELTAQYVCQFTWKSKAEADTDNHALLNDIEELGAHLIDDKMFRKHALRLARLRVETKTYTYPDPRSKCKELG